MEKERQALAMFKEGLEDKFGLISSWNIDDCCRWKGVWCNNRTGHVIALHLPSVQNDENPQFLGGKLSPSLLELEYLTYLDLSFFKGLESAIPKFIGTFARLKYLNLSWGAFGGEIPMQLWNLSNLQYLDLGNNYGLSIKNLNWLSHLSSLRYLDLSLVDLNMANDWTRAIGKLPCLTELKLSGCEIPQGTTSDSFFNSSVSITTLDLSYNYYLKFKNLNWLSHLPFLRYLDLSYVNLSEAYDWTQAINKQPFLTELKLSRCGVPLTIFPFFNLSMSLSVLDLSNNNFGIELSRFHWLVNNYSSTLTRFDLSQNKLFGKIHDDFGNMHYLEYLDLSSNLLEGEIKETSIGNLSSLRFLGLFSNKFNGTFPPCLLKLPKLETLRMSENQFQGALPEFLPSSPLIDLDLKFNKLSGSLPPSMGNLTNLKFLDFSFNNFTGLVTEDHLHNLSKLSILRLSHNALILELNSYWVPPFTLSQLSLVDCKIGPHFPLWLQNQTYLGGIDVSSCGIDDTIPNWFGHNFPRLFYLNLSNNQINGILPFWTFKLSGGYSILDLSSNRFGGPIISLCNITGDLNYLDLSKNFFSGTIPNCFMRLSNLTYLNLGSNNFSGKIPSSIGELTQIQSFHLRNNSLYGELPKSLQQCKQLRVIDVGQNKLRGKVPTWLGKNLQQLVILSLQSNEFKGEIPSNICDCKMIQILDLSINSIYGIIPNCLGNLTAMAEKGSSYVDLKSFISDQAGLYTFLETASLVWKGTESEYTNTLELVKIIDLSSNSFTGEIPYEITFLQGLVALNISRNRLHGKIPTNIGNLQHLEFLDVSRNRLSGGIPMCLTQLNFIGFIDLSSNNLSGRIPLSTQLQSFSASSYSGNLGLCGLPLPNLCPEDRRNVAPGSNRYPQVEEEEEEKLTSSDFYVAMGIGFAAGLLGTLVTLLVNSSWRIQYFRLVSSMQDSFYVWAVLYIISKLNRLLKK